MRKFLVLLLAAVMLFGNISAYAVQKESKGPSATAYEKANEKAKGVFDRAGDWLATRGKTKEEKH